MNMRLAVSFALFSCRFQEDRHHRACRQAILLVPDHAEQTRYCSRMAGKRHEDMVVMLENIVKQSLRSDVVLGEGLAMVDLPELIFFTKASLNRKVRKCLMDDRPSASFVASMLAHDFAQHLLDDRLEWSFRRNIETRVSQVGCLQTPIEWACVVVFWSWHLGFCELAFDKSIVVEGLMFALISEVSIDPVELAIAVELRPVLVPSFGAVLGFADIVWVDKYIRRTRKYT